MVGEPASCLRRRRRLAEDIGTSGGWEGIRPRRGTTRRGFARLLTTPGCSMYSTVRDGDYPGHGQSMKTSTRGKRLEKDVETLKALLEALGRRASLRDPLARAMESVGLTPQQVHSVLWLSREGRLPMGVLAHRLGVTEKTVTGVVDRLEKASLVKRVRDDVDRRVVHVCLDAEGELIAARLETGLDVRIRDLLGLLDERDREDLFRILGVLVSAFEARDPSAPVEEE